MKRILITGRNSYIGNAFEEWANQWPEKYQINKVTVRNNAWRSEDWHSYDAILHVAGIAHNSSDTSLEDLYYNVNRDLTFEIAKKAKNDGVPHFINMSSIIVFGTNQDEININTEPNPDNFYGDSKLQAEKLLETLNDPNFKITHVRPPMVYGKNSKGNFPLLAKLALKTPIFPDYDNKRSMIFIKNLTELLRLVIETGVTGFIHPQNPKYVRTSTLVKFIAEANNHKVYETRMVNLPINLFKKINLINKVFGNLYYKNDMNDGNLPYQKYTLKESIIDIYDEI
ncbi:NAD-dependent epimerase/dehydratase family protein [Aerococcus sp. L_32]|uniref:NAD-dependent epimerase/dehydratase family protein n=1 Tax=Aerococcus sp. L_32 TaxID=3422316 RepID=UPI003D6C0D82